MQPPIWTGLMHVFLSILNIGAHVGLNQHFMWPHNNQILFGKDPQWGLDLTP